jgi:UDP-N-acetylmuramoyl-tripeptide--D-alanyl-D-alanine ligase
MMQLVDIAKALHLTLMQDNESISGVSIDSRSLNKGDLFFAIKGELGDGHDYLVSAHKKGAIAAIVDHINPEVSLVQYCVEDTVLALGQFAKYWREQFSLPVIAVTGSVGKTSVRHMVSVILENHFGTEAVLFPEKNFNNQLGLPLTLLRLNEKHQFVVLEMGMRGLDEIAYLTKISQPTVAAITMAKEVHGGRVGDVNIIAKAKGELFENLSVNAVAIINADDPFCDYWQSLLATQKTLLFGYAQQAQVTAKNANGKSFDLCFNDKCIDVTLALEGKHHITNALAASAIVSEVLTDEDQSAIIKRGLALVTAFPGRMEFKKAKAGAVIIDDTYNCTICALKAALAVLEKQPGKKVLVLGDLAELGVDEIAIHKGLAALIERYDIDLFVAVGNLMRHAFEAYEGPKDYFLQQQQAANYLLEHINTQQHILVKGSRGMRMETIVQALL